MRLQLYNEGPHVGCRKSKRMTHCILMRRAYGARVGLAGCRSCSSTRGSPAWSSWSRSACATRPPWWRLNSVLPIRKLRFKQWQPMRKCNGARASYVRSERPFKMYLQPMRNFGSWNWLEEVRPIRKSGTSAFTANEKLWLMQPVVGGSSSNKKVQYKCIYNQ
jgi:hypothetical protein